MAKNKHFEDTGTLYLPVISGTVSGDPVCVGLLPGVAVTDRDSNNSATVDCEGTYDLSVTGAIASVGLPVWINPASHALTVAAATGLVVFGVALATKGSGAGVIPVRVGYPSGGVAAVGA
jgi:predicted RecA/RadA family phage recombinase